MCAYHYGVKNSSTSIKHVKNITEKSSISIEPNIVKPSLLILQIWAIVHYLRDLYQKFTMDCAAATKTKQQKIFLY